jgi:hypothetical protein
MIRFATICMFGLLEFASAQTPAKQAGAVLDDWHQAASVADASRYFGHFAPNGVFMGTDATERWTVAEFRKWAKPQFERKSAWSLSLATGTSIFPPIAKRPGSTRCWIRRTWAYAADRASLFCWVVSGKSRSTIFRFPFRMLWYTGSFSKLARVDGTCRLPHGRGSVGMPNTQPRGGGSYGITKKPVSTRSSAMRFHITRALPSAMACWKATTCPVCSAA